MEWMYWVGPLLLAALAFAFHASRHGRPLRTLTLVTVAVVVGLAVQWLVFAD